MPKFQQKILSFVVVGARQSFQYFRQMAWFLRNNRAVRKFWYWILYNLIFVWLCMTCITKLCKNDSIKANFNLTMRGTLSFFLTLQWTFFQLQNDKKKSRKQLYEFNGLVATVLLKVERPKIGNFLKLTSRVKGRFREFWFLQ